MPESRIEARARHIVAECNGIEPDKIASDSEFHDDLGLDSIDVAETAMAVEDEFKVTMPDDDMARVFGGTFGDLTMWLEQQRVG